MSPLNNQPNAKPLSCLTIDVEDWFRILDTPASPKIDDWLALESPTAPSIAHWSSLESRIARNLDQMKEFHKLGGCLI